MSEWIKCKKKPIVVEARYATKEDEEMIRRREGTALKSLGFLREDEPVWPHYMVMKGSQGEEYPISKEVWASTYQVVEE